MVFGGLQRAPVVPVVPLLLVGAGGLTGLSLLGVALGGSEAPLLLDVAVAVAAIACLPWVVGHLPRAALVVTVLAALSPVATPIATLTAVAAARTRPLRAAVAVAAAGVLAHVVQALWRPRPGLALGWWTLLVVAVYAALVAWGALSRARRQVLESLHERAVRAEADRDRAAGEARAQERTRLAREMHDVLAHRLSLLATYAGALEYRPDSSPERLAQAAGVVRDGAHQALEELRKVIGVLRHESPETEHRGDAARRRPQPGYPDLAALVAETVAAGTSVDLSVEVEGGDVGVETMPGTCGRTLYRVVQESLTNARKHAPRSAVEVAVAGGVVVASPWWSATRSRRRRTPATTSGCTWRVDGADRAGGAPAPGRRQPRLGPRGRGRGGRLRRPGLVTMAPVTRSVTRPVTQPVTASDRVTQPVTQPVTVRVLVVDDDPLVRSGLTMMLDGASGIAVAAEADDGARVQAALDRHPVDVVLMDLRMPEVDGVRATALVRSRPHPPVVVVLTTFDSDDEVLGALRAGAGGFLLKDTPPAQIVEAVLRAAAGESILSPSVTRRLVDQAVERADVAADARARLARLTARETDVARAITLGQTNAEIASDLYLSVATVKANVSQVLTKLGATNRTQVALLGHSAGLA